MKNKSEAKFKQTGELLRSFRKRSGFSQGDLARLGGFTTAFLSSIERGDASLPLQRIPSILDACECSKEETEEYIISWCHEVEDIKISISDLPEGKRKLIVDFLIMIPYLDTDSINILKDHLTT